MTRPSGDTIVALATPAGFSAIGVLRLSGPAAQGIATALTGRAKFSPGRLLLCHLRDPEGTPLDEALVVSFPGPRSYTGEDLVEIQGHGNPHLLKKILGACLAEGARLAEPGEFTLRAFLNGRIDLIQAEAVGTLVRATGVLSRRHALALLRENTLGRELADLRERILSLLTAVEALIDFPEDEIPSFDRDLAADLLGGIVARATVLSASARRGRLVHQGIRICLAGRVNVGKSSLLNRFLGEDRAIVTDLPGTTRDFLEEVLEFRGLSFRFFDTAGLREGENEAERQGISRSKEMIDRADLVLWITEATKPDGPESFELPFSCPLFQVRNKIDLGRPPGPKVENEFFVSARSGEGVEELLAAIFNWFEGGASPENLEFLLNERQLACVGRAKVCAEAALVTLRSGLTDDLLASDLYALLEELGAMTGQACPEEILDRIFSTFCVGK